MARLRCGSCWMQAADRSRRRNSSFRVQTKTFKVYVDTNGRTRATTVNVAGVLVDGIGYGAAVVKKAGGVAVTIE